MQTNQKIALLKAMGVEVWRDRFREELEEPDYFHTLQLEGPQPIIILADLDLEKKVQEQTLLEAIAKALGFVVKTFPRIWLDFESHIDHYSVVIAMGAKVSTQLKVKGPQIILTHGPSVLLKEPKLKAETWQAIRHLKVDS